MRHSKLIFIGLFSAVVGSYGCSNDNFEDIHPGIYDAPTTPCDTTGMTYDGTMKALFVTKCGADRNTCHMAPNTQDINLDNFADARDLAVNGDMMGSILHQAGYKPMPDNGGLLDQCSINKVQAWINRGCPEN